MQVFFEELYKDVFFGFFLFSFLVDFQGAGDLVLEYFIFAFLERFLSVWVFVFFRFQQIENLQCDFFGGGDCVVFVGFGGGQFGSFYQVKVSVKKFFGMGKGWGRRYQGVAEKRLVQVKRFRGVKRVVLQVRFLRGVYVSNEFSVGQLWIFGYYCFFFGC